MINPLEFLQQYCKIETEKDSVSYKPYEYSSLVKTITAKEAIKMIENDIREMTDFVLPYKLSKEQAIEETYKIWKRHLVTF